MNRIAALFKPPRFADEEKTRQAFLLHVIVWALIFMSILLFVFTLIITHEVPRLVLAQVLFSLTVNACLLVLMRRGYVRNASIIQIAAFWIFFTVTAWARAGVNHQAFQIGYALVISIAGFLLGLRGAMIMAGLSILSGGLMVAAANTALWSFTAPDRALKIWMVGLFLFPIWAVLQYLAGRLLHTALARSRMSEAQYRNLVEHIPQRIFIKDLNSTYVSCNANYARDRGIQSEQIAGKDDFAFYPKELAEGYRADDREVITNEVIKDMVEKYVVSGQERWVHTIKVPYRDDQGRVIGVLGIFDDITDRRSMEEALRESEERFRSLSNASLEGIMIHKEGLILDANRAFARLFGYEQPEELIGKIGMDFLLDPESQARIRQRMQKHEAGPIEVTGVRKDGTTFEAETESQPLKYLGHDARIVSCRNITVRKRAEKMLLESEKRFRELAELLPETVFETDLQGILTFANQSAFESFGYTQQDFAGGLNVAALIAPDDRGRAQENMQRSLHGEDIGSNEYSMLKKDGSVFPALIRSTAITHDGKPIGLRGFLIDITDRKRAEEERLNLEERLHRAEKMEALGQLAGGVAHDLNNVLGILTGYSELLLLEIPEGHRSKGHAEKILQSTEKGAAIIQDLLTLARRGVTASDVINLNSVVSDFLKTPVFEKIKDYHPRVTFRAEFDKTLLNIKGSPVHLEKTLMNLVSNAAESISGKGEVTIRTENRYLDKPLRGYDDVKEGDYAVLTVTDTGMGIPAEAREKIFEPFYTKKTMGRSGTGLGLAIVWGTVKDHSGYIDLQTEVGEGTIFTLYFPVTREEPIAQQQKVPIERYMGNGESVLVVDDIAEQRDVASRLLTQLGYEVHAVSSGEAAAEYLEENKADILILDMIMAPGIDGLETYQRVLKINPKQKAILVSGFSETERVKEAQRLGAGAYVKKPYVMERIGIAIRDEVNNPRPQDAALC